MKPFLTSLACCLFFLLPGLGQRNRSRGCNLRFCLSLLAIGCTTSVHSQTTLVEGDLAFTYLQDGEKYSFVLLRDVDFGTQIVVKSGGSIITGWTAPAGGASAGDVITVSTSDVNEEGAVAFYGGASCAFTGLAQISPRGFDTTDDECTLSTGQSLDWSNQRTAAYTGPRTGLTASEHLVELNDSSNWTTYDDNTTDYNDTTPFTIDGDGSGGNGNTDITTIYTQGFESYTLGTTNPSDDAWFLSNTTGADKFQVTSRSGSLVFEGDDTNNEATWVSEWIDISDFTNVELDIDLAEDGSQDSDDFIRVSYLLDGGTAVSLVQLNDDYGTSAQGGLSVPDGSALRIQVVINTDANDEEQWFDNIELTGTPTTTGEEVLYFEDFTFFPDNYGLANGGNSGGYDGTETEWSISGDPSTLTATNDYFMVENIGGDNAFSGRDLDGEFTWTSKAIDVAGFTDLTFVVELEEEGTLESDDHIKLYYVKDDQSEILIAELIDDFGSNTITEDAFEASVSLRFRFKIQLNGGLENYRFDNLTLQGRSCASGNVDGDAFCDNIDNCTNPSAVNFDDPANADCVLEVFYEPFIDAVQFSQNVNFSSDGESDYWGIYDPDGSNDNFGSNNQPSGIGSFAGTEGSFLVGEDMNSAPIVADPGILTWSNIDISSFNALLNFELDIAERGATSDEFVKLYAKLSSDTEYTLVLDPAGTLASISETFTTQTAQGSFDGTSLDLQLWMYSDDGSDELAVDNLRVTGTANCLTVTTTASPMTVDLDYSGEVTVNADMVSALSTGDCFTVSSYEVSKTQGGTYTSSVTYDCTETGAQTLYVRATDGSNVSTPTSVTVTVQDADAPSAPSVSVSDIELGADGTATISASSYASGSTDNCSSQGLTYLVSTDGASGFATALDVDCTDLGALTLYFRAQDASGNQSASTLAGDGTFTVVDMIGPVIATPSGTFSFGSGASSSPDTKPIFFGSTIDWTEGYSDNCTADGDLILQVSKTGTDWGTATGQVVYDCSEAGAQTVYLRATDASGNATTVSGSIVLEDVDAPVITAVSPPSIMLDAGTGQAMLSTSTLTFDVVENCTAAADMTYLISLSEPGTYAASFALNCSDLGLKTFYFKAVDASGNESAPFAQTIEVLDATGIVAIAQDISVNLDASGNYTLDAVAIDNGSLGNCNSTLSVSPSSFDCDDLGANEVTLTISDGTNSHQTTATVTVFDVTPPNFTALPSLTVDVDANGNDIIVPTDAGALAIAADACTPNGDIVWEIQREGDASFASSIAVDCADIGVPFNVLLRATDASGNATISETIPVSVVDNTAPTITSVAEGLSEALGAGGTVTISASDCATGSDNCAASHDLLYTMSETSGSGFASTFEADCDDLGTKTFYFRATDASGNISAVQTGNITLEDNLPPVAAAQDIALSLLGGAVVLEASNSAFNLSTDNCGLSNAEVKLASSPDGAYASSMSFTGYGEYDVVLRVTDTAGNASTSGATVSITGILYAEDFEDETPDNPNDLCSPAYTPADGNWSLPCADGRVLLNDTPDPWLRIRGQIGGGGATSAAWNSATFDIGDASQLLLTFDARSEGGLEDSGTSADRFVVCVIRDFVEDPTPLVLKNGQLTNSGDGAQAQVDSSFSRLIDAQGASQLSLRVKCLISTPDEGEAYSVDDFVVCADVNGNGICDHEEGGCTDPAACNYDPNAATDNGGCAYSDLTAYFPFESLDLSLQLDSSGVVFLDETTLWTALGVDNECGAFSVEYALDTCGNSSGYLPVFTSPGFYALTAILSDASSPPISVGLAVEVNSDSTVGCSDVTACNYNRPDLGTDCVYPGEIGWCSDPANGVGYVLSIDPLDPESCLCLSDEFDLLYFEDFGPGGAAGGPDSGYGYDGYTDVNGDGSTDVNTAANEPEWSLDFDDVNVGNGTLDGSEPDYWTTISVTDGGGAILDTVFDGSWLASPCRWTTRNIPLAGRGYVRTQMEMTEDGALEPSDYIEVRLIEDAGTPSVFGSIVDDSPTPFPAYSTIDVDQSTTAGSIQIQVEAFNDASGEYHTFDDVRVSAWGLPGCIDARAVNFDSTADLDNGQCLYDADTLHLRTSGTHTARVWDTQTTAAPMRLGGFSTALDATTSIVIGTGRRLVITTTGPNLGVVHVDGLKLEANAAIYLAEGTELHVHGTYVPSDGIALYGPGEFNLLESSNGDSLPYEASLTLPELTECGCLPIPDGDCDCDGNQLDVLGVCGGDCSADEDNDGICDDADPCIGQLDECGVCNGPGSAYECGCFDIPEGDCDCDGNQLDALGDCAGPCAADVDQDGICDDVDDCVGALDECGVCNGPGTIYDCGCTDYPEGACDCEGNTLDAVGICNGDCTADTDGDGICDDVDDCLGDLDACGLCNGPGAVFDCGCSCIPLGDCDCDGNQLDALGDCGGTCTSDVDGDGVCDNVDDCVGTLDDCGICNGPGAIFDCGCSGILAGDCDCDGNQLDALGVCGGTCTADADGDGMCDDVDDCVGTLDDCGICNGPGAIYDCGCSGILAGDCDCDGNQLDALGVCGGDCLTDVDGDGVCDDDETPGCTNPFSCNFDASATDDDGSCLTEDATGECGGTCTADADGDGVCDDVDDCVGQLDACGICNGPGSVFDCGCSGIPAGDCNCDGNQLDALGVCGGTCTADVDGDGVCDDVDDCVGTLDDCGICNGPGSIYDCGCSSIPAGDCDCDGNQLDALNVCGGTCSADADGDGVCDDVDDCVGTLDDCGICNGPGAIYDCGCSGILAGDCDCSGNQLDALGICGGDCLADIDGDGVCDVNEVPGCTNPFSCNYDASATDDDGSCLTEDATGECGGICTADADGDGVCDDVDDCVGMLDDCGICNGPGAIYDCGCSGIPAGDCDCNGNQLDALGVCGGGCELDANANGICDDIEPSLCGEGTIWNFETGQCEGLDECPGDLDDDGFVGVGDILDLLVNFGVVCAD